MYVVVFLETHIGVTVGSPYAYSSGTVHGTSLRHLSRDPFVRSVLSRAKRIHVFVNCIHENPENIYNAISTLLDSQVIPGYPP